MCNTQFLKLPYLQNIISGIILWWALQVEINPIHHKTCFFLNTLMCVDARCNNTLINLGFVFYVACFHGDYVIERKEFQGVNCLGQMNAYFHFWGLSNYFQICFQFRWNSCGLPSCDIPLHVFLDRCPNSDGVSWLGFRMVCIKWYDNDSIEIPTQMW